MGNTEVNAKLVRALEATYQTGSSLWGNYWRSTGNNTSLCWFIFDFVNRWFTQCSAINLLLCRKTGLTILAPTLFNIFFSVLLKHSFRSADEGILLRTRSDGKLFFSLTMLSLSHIANESSDRSWLVLKCMWGLRSLKKTCAMANFSMKD